MALVRSEQHECKFPVRAFGSSKICTGIGALAEIYEDVPAQLKANPH